MIARARTITAYEVDCPDCGYRMLIGPDELTVAPMDVQCDDCGYEFAMEIPDTGPEITFEPDW